MKKHYYRVTFEGYQDLACFTENEAKQEFIDFIENEDFDVYGRTWQDHVAVEDLGEIEEND